MTDMKSDAFAYELLVATFPDSQVKSFNQAKPGQPPRWLSYIEDETVMDRLDAAIGFGRWTITVDAVNATVARVTLSVKWPESDQWISYSDFGYPTNGDRGEALKEAVSDGIRRCGRFIGIFRYGYAGQAPAHAPSQTRAAAPATKPVDAPYDASDLQDIDDGDGETECLQHREKWITFKSGARGHKNGVWEDSGKDKWCMHPHDRKQR